MKSIAGRVKTPHIKKVLVVRLDALGDTILTTPLLNTLKSNSADLTVDALVTPYTKPLLQNCPLVNRVLALRTNQDKGAVVNEIKKIMENSYDLVLAASPTDWSYRAAYLSKAPARAGIIYSERPLSAAAQLIFRIFTHPVYASPRGCLKNNRPVPHETEQVLSLLAPFGFEKMSQSLWMEPSGEDKEEGAKALEKLGWGDKPFICIHVSDKWLEEGFQMHNFRGLSSSLFQLLPDFNQLYTYGPKEEKTARELKTLLSGNPGAGFTGDLSIMAWAYVVSQSRVMICPDTSAIHCASAQGVPVAAVYGSVDFGLNSQKFAPWRVPCKIFKKGEPVALINRITGGVCQLLGRA